MQKTVIVRSELKAPIEKVWKLLERTDTLTFVAWPLVTYDGQSRFPTYWRNTGLQINLRPRLFGLFPQGDYFVEVQSFSAVLRCIRTHEYSATVARWDHTMSLEETDTDCVMTDQIDIEADTATIRFAQLFYRWRHWRWNRLLAQR